MSPPQIPPDWTAKTQVLADEQTFLTTIYMDFTGMRSLEVNLNSDGSTGSQVLTIDGGVTNTTYEVTYTASSLQCEISCGCPCPEPPAPCTGCDVVVKNEFASLSNATFRGQCPTVPTGNCYI